MRIKCPACKDGLKTNSMDNQPQPMGSQLMAKPPVSFQYVQPTDEQKELMQNFRDKYQTLSEELRGLMMSRGLALALTKLEESAFWLNKSITKND